MSVLPEPGMISFARGIPAPELLPVEELAESARRALARHGRTALNYGAPAGFAPLREWIASRHGVPASRVFVTPGSLVALNLLVAHLLPEPRTVLVEAPTYDRALRLITARGAAIATVPNTDDGLDLDRLRALLETGAQPAFLYVLPTFHNPTGRTLSRAQREQLAELAVAHRLVVIEDDPYGLVRLDGRPEPTVHELLRAAGDDELGILMSSFSKAVAPGLRVGYAVVPEAMIAALDAAATSLYLSPALLPQAELFEFLDGGLLEPHLERVTALLRPRRDALLDVLGGSLPEGARLTRPDGGYFAWLDLPAPYDAARLAERGREAGVAFVPGAAFFPEAGGERSARLSFSFPDVGDIRTGAQRLADLLV